MMIFKVVATTAVSKHYKLKELHRIAATATNNIAEPRSVAPLHSLPQILHPSVSQVIHWPILTVASFSSISQKPSCPQALTVLVTVSSPIFKAKCVKKLLMRREIS